MRIEWRILSPVIALMIGNPIQSQNPVEDGIEWLDNLPDEAIEQLQENSSILEDLQDLRDNPLDLNEVEFRDLELLNLLTPAEINSILQYRDANGSFIHPNELQVIEELPLEKVRQLLPYVSISDQSLQREGKGYVLVRSAGYLPRRKGFRSEDNTAPPYQSGPLGWLIKFRNYQSRNFSWGGSLELDAGEPFNFRNRPGFDQIHLHYYKTGRTGFVKTVALGDYRISLGQGLLQYQGFAVTKPSNPLLIKRVSPVILPYTGSGEYYYFRGGAVEMGSNPDFQNFLFLHYTGRDATVRSYPEDNYTYFSAFQTDGLHRSLSEENKRNQVSETVAGHRIQWQINRNKLGLNSLFQLFSLPYLPVSRIDNVHRLTGSRFVGHSLDFSSYLGSLHFFGEVATQNYRTPAFLFSGLYSFNSRLDGGFLIRRYPAYYAPTHSNAFSAHTLPNNESGIYVGINYHLGPYSRISFYLDSWKGFWPTFQAHGPTFDQDIFVKYEVSNRRKWEAYGQLKFKQRADNQSNSHPGYHTIASHTQWNLRLQFRRIKYQKWKWTNRLEMVRFQPGEPPAEYGFMGFTDLMWSPIGKSWSVASRLAWFKTESYFSRIYTYEPDILYSFTIPSFYGHGWRMALRVSRKWKNGFRIEMRTGWTLLPGEEEVGSGLNAVPGPFSQQLKLQMMYRF